MRIRLMPTVGALIATLFVGTAVADGDWSQVMTVAEMRSKMTNEAVGGASWLTRFKRSIRLNVSTSGLQPGAIYTIWVFVFNHPEYCEDVCDGGDLGVDEVDTSIFWGTGFVAADGGPGIGGVANVEFRVRRGRFPGQSLSGNGLTNVAGAEIHIQLRSHGDPIPARASEQLTTAAGACEVFGCVDEQFAVHHPAAP